MWCLLKAFQLLHLLLFLLIFQANLSSSSSSITQLCSPEEAAALIQFKTSFSIDEYSSGECDESYPKTNSWKEGSDCCSWDGVTCDNIKGQVIGLDLSCSQLYGSIPFNSSLFHLPHLQKLNLAFNNFNYSEMSSKFSGFASLMYLNLSDSNFAGEVPSQISHLSKLVSLDLSQNYYQTIDKHTLEGPNRGYNENLGLYFPKVNQSINLQLLDLSGMSFSTESIDSIGNLQSLKYLDLCGTSFPGGLPKTIMNLSSLEHLDASVSSFSGGLDNSIGNLLSLEYLNLQLSDLSGSIPISLGNLSQLNYLDLTSNYFSGQIPSSLTNLRQLELLDISYNQLEGSIPDEVAAFPNLISLDLSFNLLNGTLPSWLYTASTLKYIAVRNNQLNGDVKEFKYKSLEEIFLRNNKLTGPIPSSIFQFVNLTILDLSSNNLSGIVEFDMFSKLQNLQHLDLSYNSLSLSSNGCLLQGCPVFGLLCCLAVAHSHPNACSLLFCSPVLIPG
ncbi:hypothetical protein POUND7_006627 [Theobroma cacao]